MLLFRSSRFSVQWILVSNSVDVAKFINYKQIQFRYKAEDNNKLNSSSVSSNSVSASVIIEYKMCFRNHLSKPMTAAARNPNSIRDRKKTKPGKNPGSVGGRLLVLDAGFNNGIHNIYIISSTNKPYFRKLLQRQKIMLSLEYPLSTGNP